MGYVGKLEEKYRAQELRKDGLSYKEILQYLTVSKDTISRWCKDIPLSKKQKKRLIENAVFGQKKGSIIAAENKRQKRIVETRQIMDQARTELGLLSKRDRFVAGIALYAGEGEKAGGGIGFSNANPDMIKFMANWFREFCRPPETKLRGAIWLHEGLNEETAKKYWSKLVRIPTNQFQKTYIAENKVGSRKIRKNIHQYGIFSIRFNNTRNKRQILGWIYALLNGKIQ